MSRQLTIIMYHYVRELEKTRFPRIKARRISEFRAQIHYLKREYNLVTVQDVVNAIRNHSNLPDKAALLTFDDGYIEHFSTVFPILFDNGIQGSFFPPVATAERGELLDVNRVHFLLAVADSYNLGSEIDSLLPQYAAHYSLLSSQDYRSEWAKADRFDDAETIYVKRMLQHVLPEKLRNDIARNLFAKYVSIDETAFAAEIYLNVDQLRVMQRCGMYIGSHGDSHYWLNTINAEALEKEIKNSLRFLRDIGSPVDDFWVMCYPYGAYSDAVLKAVRACDCTFGLTTKVKVADLDRDDPLLLPRLDTNDFPVSYL